MDLDSALRNRLEPPTALVPAFDAVWQAAELRLAAARQRRRRLAAMAAVVAVLALILQLRSPDEEVRYIDTAELLDSTVWTAPSDVLLPKHEFDIYQELPELPTSTNTAGGTLL